LWLNCRQILAPVHGLGQRHRVTRREFGPDR
jgi:hypothetical protein